MQFSYFKGGATAVIPMAKISFLQLIDIYKSDAQKQLTATLKAETNPETRKTLKNQQNFITPSGVFTYRNNKNIVHHNENLVAFDFDGMPPEDAQTLKAKIFQNDSCILAAISGSGKGVKAFILVNDNLSLNRYEILKYNSVDLLEALNISEYCSYLDLRQFVLSQPMYLSYDAGLLFKDQFKPLNYQFKAPPPPPEKLKTENLNFDLTNKDKSAIYKYIEAAVNNLISFYNSHQGARHSQIARTKAIASAIKQYNLIEIEQPCYAALEAAIIAMYGSHQDALKANAIKSMRQAWEDATSEPNESIDNIIKQNENVAIPIRRFKKIGTKAAEITDLENNKMMLPISLIQQKSNYIILPRWLAEKKVH
jgi:hypothetical protein